ncbi:hypothetical protein ACLX1H_007221 [Fusarium chlamydosporum]
MIERPLKTPPLRRPAVMSTLANTSYWWLSLTPSLLKVLPASDSDPSGSAALEDFN